MAYTIQHGKIEDLEGILRFIKEHWSQEHIFVTNQELFKYQYVFQDNINFVLGKDEDGSIKSVLGYIKYSEEYKNADIFLALWMTAKDSKDSMIGTKLLDFLINMPFKSVSCVGIANSALPIYRFMGFKVGKLEQWYKLNPKCEDFKIADIKKYEKLDISLDDTKVLKEINYISEEEFRKLVQVGYQKDFWYFKHRYVDYPYYKYIMLGIYQENILESILVCRVIAAEQSRVIRIMDIIGNKSNLNTVADQIEKYMIKNQCEYMDIYQIGMDKQLLESTGFVLNTHSENVIPNYFEPFVKSNVDINYATRIEGDCTFFKGDGDQDRPNRID